MHIEHLLITTIKTKKPLHNLDDAFVLDYVKKYFQEHPTIYKKLQQHDPRTLPKARHFKIIIKTIRNELNRIYGVYWTGKNMTLASHPSTRERMPIYPELYHKIFTITGIPDSIVDLAAGLNPLSYQYMDGFHGSYLALELTSYECTRLQELVTQHKFPIHVQQCNIFHDPIPAAEMCFMFKILDTLETKGHKKAEALLRKTPARYIIASFATTTLHNKPMRHSHRGWIERMLTRLHYTYKILEFENEIFYIIMTSYSTTPTTA